MTNGKLGLAFYEISKNCERRKSLPIIKPSEEVTHVVLADQELSFQYSVGFSETYCLLNLRFLPEDGHKYVFNAKSELFSCYWEMNDATKKVSMEKREWLRGDTENSAFCKD
ncbi:hypothetical protein DC094_02035 [Pelagibaculum spongiae]|uniref:Uncharacterized protein n=2 Tax=Pelagibaculum spongiae TaxID=2080658 RepID=A0A2V1GZG7_9GAMM|nr:hypothetical protein DC094_02035 [Pelagibaculum spongiae]